MRRVPPLAGLLIASGLLLGAKSCPPPAPPATCPAACPPGTACLDPARGCQPIPPPGPACEVGVEHCGCYVMPPELGEWLELRCSEGETCSAEKQCVAGSASVCPACPAGSSCTDPAVGCVKDPTPPGPPQAPLIRDEELTVVMCGSVPCESAPSQMWDETSRAINRWRALHPEQWNAAGTCLSGGPPGIDDAFLGISSELLRVEIVAGQSVKHSGERSDCTFVNRPTTDLYEEGHLFDYARACVATGPSAMKKLYRRGGAPPPVEPPPPTAGCSPPAVPKVDKWGMAFRNRWWDCTPLFYGRDTATWAGLPVSGYCEAIGMPDRLHCPARQEGDPERRACEGVGIGGDPAAVPLWRCENGQPEVNPVQPFQARCDAGWIETCSTDGAVCAREVMP